MPFPLYGYLSQESGGHRCTHVLVPVFPSALILNSEGFQDGKVIPTQDGHREMKELSFWHRVERWIRGFVYGAAQSWVMAPLHLRRREDLERMWITMMFSELAGAPLAPPDLRLRLLPYLVPHILYWRHRLSLWDEQMETTHFQHLGH